MNKKGDFLNNVLSVIIAVLGIALLTYAGVKLYNVSVNQEHENVKKFLNVLSEKINNLKDGEKGSFPLRGVDNWYLVGWSEDDITRPDKCFLNSCICVCKDIAFKERKEVSSICQQAGFCKELDKKEIVIFKKIKYTNAEDVFDKIVLRSNIQEILVSKESNKIEISTVEIVNNEKLKTIGDYPPSGV